MLGIHGDTGEWQVNSPTVILIAEDNADNREGYVEYLTFFGYRVEQAADGNRAWALTQELHPDVLLLDLALPGLTAGKSRGASDPDPGTRSTLIIALSACVTPATCSARRPRIDLFLDKPCYPRPSPPQSSGCSASRSDASTGPASTPPSSS